MPDPDTVKNLIQLEKIEATAAVRGQRRELMRREMMSGLRLTVTIPDQTPALGEAASAATQRQTGDPTSGTRIGRSRRKRSDHPCG